MFKVVMMDGSQELPQDNIYFMITKNGPYMKKHLDLIECVVPVKTIPTLQEVTSYAKMNIPKIPQDMFSEITAFFREVYEEYRAECMVLLFLNRKTNEYYIHVPHQKVSGGSIDYHRGFVMDGHTMVCSIHSHAGFGAFHSGTDHKDEEHFDGLHITIGKLGDKFVEIASSIMANGSRFKVDPSEYIDDIEEIEEDDVDMFYYIGTSKVKLSGKVSKSPKYIVESVYFNYDWMDMVEGTKFSYVKEVNRGIFFGEDDEFDVKNYYKYFKNSFLPSFEEKKDEKEEKPEKHQGPCKTCPFNSYKTKENVIPIK